MPSHLQLQLQLQQKISADGALIYHFPTYYAPTITKLEPLGQDSMNRLRAELKLDAAPPINIWLTERLDDYFTWHALPMRAPTWAVGLSLTDQHTVLLRQALGQGGTPDELHRTFRHELAHVAIDLARRGHPVPRWFNEGYAQHHAQEWTLERSELVSRMAASGLLIPFADLERHFPDHQDNVSLAYSQSLHFTRHLARQFGPDVFGRILQHVSQGVPFHDAFEHVTGSPLADVEQAWREQLSSRTTPWSNLADGSFLFVPTAFLILIGWYRRKKRAQDKLARLDDNLDGWDYDPSRYKLPGVILATRR
jgi:hypothetical protein